MIVKGVRVGEGRTKTIVPLVDADSADALASARRAVDLGADCLELRADLLANGRDAAAVAELIGTLNEQLPQTPVILTMRTKGQGGRLDAPVDEYTALVADVLSRAHPDFVDVELGAGYPSVRQLVATAHKRGALVIVSHHDFKKTPDEELMLKLLVRMAQVGADIPKLAVMARTPEDALSLMKATTKARTLLNMPLLTMSMGPEGRRTRLEGETFGSALTFCSLGKASAPGQVELGTALEALEAVHVRMLEDA